MEDQTDPRLGSHAAEDHVELASRDLMEAQRRTQARSDEAELDERDLLDEIARLRGVIDRQNVDLGEIRLGMAARAVIEQAKGMIMSATHCDADEAFAYLLVQSQNTNTKLRLIAQCIVDDASRRDRQRTPGPDT